MSAGFPVRGPSHPKCFLEFGPTYGSFFAQVTHYTYTGNTYRELMELQQRICDRFLSERRPTLEDQQAAVRGLAPDSLVCSAHAGATIVVARLDSGLFSDLGPGWLRSGEGTDQPRHETRLLSQEGFAFGVQVTHHPCRTTNNWAYRSASDVNKDFFGCVSDCDETFLCETIVTVKPART